MPHRGEWYVLPLILVLFGIHYHYYDFYAVNFADIRHFIDAKATEGKYLQVQRQNPYWELYEQAQQYLGSASGIYLVFTSDTSLDYTTTYYTKKQTYISELAVMTNYFFYPRIILRVTMKELRKMTLQKNDLVIADRNIAAYIPATQSGLLRLPESIKKPYVMVNKKFEEPYYLFVKQ